MIQCKQGLFYFFGISKCLALSTSAFQLHNFLLLRKEVSYLRLVFLFFRMSSELLFLYILRRRRVTRPNW